MANCFSSYPHQIYKSLSCSRGLSLWDIPSQTSSSIPRSTRAYTPLAVENLWGHQLFCIYTECPTLSFSLVWLGEQLPSEVQGSDRSRTGEARPAWSSSVAHPGDGASRQSSVVPQLSVVCWPSGLLGVVIIYVFLALGTTGRRFFNKPLEIKRGFHVVFLSPQHVWVMWGQGGLLSEEFCFEGEEGLRIESKQISMLPLKQGSS